MRDSPVKDCFIDTNVWLYAFIESDDPAKSAVARTLVQTTTPSISIQVVNEVCANLLKRASATEQEIRDLLHAFFEKYRLIPLAETVLLDASRLRDRFSLSYWDSLIVAAALASGASVLYSEDMQDGLEIRGDLRIVNPFA
jgi:predicted nucleic acid-binding protein